MRNLQAGTGLDDGRLIVELRMSFDVQVGVDTNVDTRKPFKWMSWGLPVEVVLCVAGKAEIGPYYVSKQRERSLACLEVAHQGHERVALLDDFEKAVVDIYGVAARRDVPVDV